MAFGIIGVLLLAGVLLGKIAWGWGILGAIFLYWSAIRFWTKYKAASNVILARHTFDLLSEPDRKKVLAAVSNILLNAKYPSSDPEQELKSMSPEQRYGFIALGMARSGIAPKLGGGWYEVHNPYAEILGAYREIAWIKHQVKLKYGIDVSLGEADVSTVQHSAQLAQNLSVHQNDKQCHPKESEALYQKARAAFDRGYGIRNWDATNNPAIYSIFEIFQRLSDENFGKAYYPLSILYQVKQGNEEDHSRARHYAQMAFGWCNANQNYQNTELCCDLGCMYLNGWGVEQSDEQAIRWFHIAAEQGHAASQRNLGIMYDIRKDNQKNPIEAIKWYRLAAEQGDADAQNTLGERYSKGRGVEQDNEQATYWYRKYAEQAVHWYRKPAEKGNAKAQYKLGLIYDHARDDKEAMKWYQLAAEQGDAKAQWEVGFHYLNGWGVDLNEDQATYWLQMAAEQGHVQAKRELGYRNSTR